MSLVRSDSLLSKMLRLLLTTLFTETTPADKSPGASLVQTLVSPGSFRSTRDRHRFAPVLRPARQVLLVERRGPVCRWSIVRSR